VAVHARRCHSRRSCARVVHIGCSPGFDLRNILDYASNVKNDPFFIPAGAEAFRNALPNAEVQFLDTGHYATETHFIEIALPCKSF